MAFQAGLYWIIDPLCGWSYGALPLLNRMAQHFPLQQFILPGGLFVGSQRRRLDANWLAHVNEHDARIATLTGMPFGTEYRDNLLASADLLLDSLPATRGLLAAQCFVQNGADLRFLNAIQTAWYQDGRDITRPEIVNDVLRQTAGDSIVLEHIPEHEALSTVQHGRMLMAEMGGQGFPSAVIISRDGDCRLQPVGKYYGNPDAFFAMIQPQLIQAIQ